MNLTKLSKFIWPNLKWSPFVKELIQLNSSRIRSIKYSIDWSKEKHAVDYWNTFKISNKGKEKWIDFCCSTSSIFVVVAGRVKMADSCAGSKVAENTSEERRISRGSVVGFSQRRGFKRPGLLHLKLEFQQFRIPQQRIPRPQQCVALLNSVMELDSFWFISLFLFNKKVSALLPSFGILSRFF